MFKLILTSFFFYFILVSNTLADEGFNKWVKKFELRAINSGVSKKVVQEIMSDAKFLPKVIEYDRYQPEFYEDTYLYKKIIQ